MSNTIITISRSYGSGGRTIGKMLAKSRDIPFYDRDLIYLASEKSGIDIGLLSQNDESLKKSLFEIRIPTEKNQYVSKDEMFRTQSQIIRDVADKSDCVIIGRCADHILKDGKHKLLRVFIHAPEYHCVQTVMDTFNISEAEAVKTIKQVNKHRADYYKYHTGTEWGSAANFDLCFDTSRLSYEKIVKAISGYVYLFTTL